ncbi:MAG: hypothetical protein JWP81_3007 [Ferruginibacter sp.]|nr:hypothetical protein [Ferruginibacter sp.]
MSKPGSASTHITSVNFANALIEAVTYDSKYPHRVAKYLEEIIDGIERSNSLSSEMKRILLQYGFEAKEVYQSLSEKSSSETELFKKHIQRWFENSVENLKEEVVSKYASKFILYIAILITIFLNADTIAISKFLYTNPEANAKVISETDAAVKNDTLYKKIAALSHLTQGSTSDSLKSVYIQVEKELKSKLTAAKQFDEMLHNNLPFGWKGDEFRDKNAFQLFNIIITKLMGMAITIFAIILGTPFWLDILNKISTLKPGGK